MRQLLQFMASRGSVIMRRAGRRSMPIWGLDMVGAGGETTVVDIQTALGARFDTYLAGSSRCQETARRRQEHKKHRLARREMDVQIKAAGVGTAVGTDASQGRAWRLR